MLNMYLGLWQDSLNSLRSFSEWAAFLLLVGSVLGLGYISAKTIGNPLGRVTTNRLLLLFILLLASAPVTFQMQAKALQIEGSSPHGIVSFELAKTQEKAKAIVDTWNATTIKNRENVEISASDQARRELLLDFPFIFFYVTVSALICFWFAETTAHSQLALIALILGWSAPFAGILDVIENIALLNILNGNLGMFLAPLAFWCALPKLFVTLCLIVPFAAGVVFAAGWNSLRGFAFFIMKK